jgi:hypothetical protein
LDKDVANMEDLENWLRGILRQREQDETAWFLNRPSLKRAKEITELA